MEEIRPKKPGESITKQYDTGGMADAYNTASSENVENDAGRVFLREVVRDLPRESAMIDVGCGSGLDLAAYQAMGFKNLYGIDPSEKFIDADMQSLKGIEFQQGTFEHIPYSDAHFDAVVSRFAMHYSRDIQASLREVARVLKPGGTFAAIVSHPEADALERRDENGNVTITLFNGTVSITYPQHVLDEYLAGAFEELFDLEAESAYCGTEQDRGRNGLPNTLFFVAIRK